MTIVVASCDAYFDIVKQYVEFWRKNWSDCKYSIIIAMEEIEFKEERVEALACGRNTTWTQRVIKAIKYADTEYILLSVDDLFMSQNVDSEEIEKVLDFIEKEKIVYYRIPVFKFSDTHKTYYEGQRFVEKIPRNQRYNVSIGTAFWNSSELLNILGDGSMSAWDLENYFLKQAEQASPGFMDGYVSDERFLLHSVHMIKSGKWIPSSVKKMRKLGYHIDIAQRGYINFSDRLKLNIVYSWCSRKFPSGLRSFVKKVMTCFGFQFASK